MARYGLAAGAEILEIPYDRGELATLFRDLKFSRGAEIGVEKGNFSETLCLANPGLQLHCIDPWKIRPQHFEKACTRLSPYHCSLIRKNSMEAVVEFGPESLDFVYIDARHNFDYVVRDIIEWTKVVRMGGIVSGHDYVPLDRKGQADDLGVIEAVNGYVSAHHLWPLFVFSKCRSWMFVKE